MCMRHACARTLLDTRSEDPGAEEHDTRQEAPRWHEKEDPRRHVVQNKVQQDGDEEEQQCSDGQQD